VATSIIPSDLDLSWWFHSFPRVSLETCHFLWFRYKFLYTTFLLECDSHSTIPHSYCILTWRAVPDYIRLYSNRYHSTFIWNDIHSIFIRYRSVSLFERHPYSFFGIRYLFHSIDDHSILIDRYSVFGIRCVRFDRVIPVDISDTNSVMRIRASAIPVFEEGGDSQHVGWRVPGIPEWLLFHSVTMAIFNESIEAIQ